MPKMRGEEARPDPNGLPGKDLKKELIPIILCGEAGKDFLVSLLFLSDFDSEILQFPTDQ